MHTTWLSLSIHPLGSKQKLFWLLELELVHSISTCACLLAAAGCAATALFIFHSWKAREQGYWPWGRLCRVPCLWSCHMVGSLLVFWCLANIDRYSSWEELQFQWWRCGIWLLDHCWWCQWLLHREYSACNGGWLHSLLGWEYCTCGIWNRGVQSSSAMPPTCWIAGSPHSQLVLKLWNFFAEHTVLIPQLISLYCNLFAQKEKQILNNGWVMLENATSVVWQAKYYAQ